MLSKRKSAAVTRTDKKEAFKVVFWNLSTPCPTVSTAPSRFPQTVQPTRPVSQVWEMDSRTDDSGLENTQLPRKMTCAREGPRFSFLSFPRNGEGEAVKSLWAKEPCGSRCRARWPRRCRTLASGIRGIELLLKVVELHRVVRVSRCGSVEGALLVAERLAHSRRQWLRHHVTTRTTSGRGRPQSLAALKYGTHRQPSVLGPVRAATVCFHWGQAARSCVSPRPAGPSSHHHDRTWPLGRS